MVCEGKKDPHTSCAWWDDCIHSVMKSICQDRTTTKDDLHEKAKNYALNYLAICPESSYIDKNSIANEIADEIEERLKDTHFDQRPLAGVVAQMNRGKVPEDPEEKFIKLG